MKRTKETLRNIMKMYFAGDWVDTAKKIEVHNPFDGSVIDTVPRAGAAEADRAIASAVEGARVMREMPAYERYKILRKAAELLAADVERLARTISSEEG